MRGSRLYYGWFVLAASALSEMLVVGATSYSAGLFILPLQAEFHISRADANSAVQLPFLGAMLAAPFAGQLLDKCSIRWVMPLAAVVLGLCFAGVAISPSRLIMALLLLVPASLAVMCLAFLNTSTLAARWFRRHRGLALGIAAVAISGGGFTVAPLLSEGIQLYGWRNALLYEAGILTVIILALSAVVRDRPSDMGLETHSENQGGEKDAASGGDRVTWRGILTSRAFWVPSLTIAAISGTSQAVVLTVKPYGVELGFSAASATLLISAFAVAAAVTKVLSGALADRIAKRLFLIAAPAAMTCCWLLLAALKSYAALFIASCMAGVALGLALPVVAALIAASFGTIRFGRILGWIYALTLLLALLSGRFVGFMYDRFGSYHMAFQCFAAVMACVLAMTLLVSPQRRSA